MRIRGSRDFEIIREGEDGFAVLHRVDNSSGVCFCTLKFGAGVGLVCKRGAGHKGQCGERSDECLFHSLSLVDVFVVVIAREVSPQRALHG